MHIDHNQSLNPPLDQLVDPESASLISSAMKTLEDPEAYQQLLAEVRTEFNTFFAQSRNVIMQRLKAKMIRGAQEHGAPSHTHDELTAELTNEYIDLLGWTLVKKWNQQK